MYGCCAVVAGSLLMFWNARVLCFKLAGYLRLFLLLNSPIKGLGLLNAKQRVCSECYYLTVAISLNSLAVRRITNFFQLARHTNDLGSSL